MPTIRCLLDDVVVARAGRPTILSALIEAEVPTAHKCGGKGSDPFPLGCWWVRGSLGVARRA